jgi:hypothetical protein
MLSFQALIADSLIAPSLPPYPVKPLCFTVPTTLDKPPDNAPVKILSKPSSVVNACSTP